MKLFFRDIGAGERTLIILHGLFGSSDNWLTIAKTLSESFRVILVDQRNHGRSPWSDEFSYAAMADDLKELTDDLQPARPVFIGHSMGGKTVMNYAVRYAEENHRFVVVDIGVRYYRPHHEDILQGLTSIQLFDLTSRAEADAQLAHFVPELGVRQFLLKNLYRNEEGKFDWRMNLAVLRRNIEEVGRPIAEEAVCTNPTLFIRGEKSNYIKDGDVPDILRHFPNAQFATIAGAGHWVQAEKPEEFTKEVLNFLE